MRHLPQPCGTGSASRPRPSRLAGSGYSGRGKINPNADDPLFRSIDADDGKQDFTLLRTRALIKVRVPLPDRVRLTDDPTATHVTLSRAVPPLNMLKHTAPYQQDRTAKTLEEQALGAVNAHMEPTVQPTEEFLETVAEFQRHIFSSAKVKKAVGGHRRRRSDP